MTPCDFERRAGRSSSKNWNRTIRYAGKPIGEFLQGVVNQYGKKEVRFVVSDPPLCSSSLGSSIADSANHQSLSVSAVSLAGNGSIVTSKNPVKVVPCPAVPDKCVTVPASPVVSVTVPASPVVSVTVPASPVVSVTVPANPDVSVTAAASPDVFVPAPASPDVSVTVPASPPVTVPASPPVTVPASPDVFVSVPANPDVSVTVPASPSVTVPASPDVFVTVPASLDVSVPASPEVSVSVSASPVVSVPVPASPDVSVTVPASPDTFTSASPVVATPASFDPIVPPTASFGDVVTTPASLDPIVTSTASPDVGTPASPDVVTPAPSSSVTVDTSAVPECSSVLTCPICTKSCSSCSLLWQHINSVHISRAVFPPAAFFAKCNHLICSVPSCRWASHDRYRKTGCRHLLKPGQHCNAPLVSASDLPAVFSIQLPPSSPSPPLVTSTNIPSDPLELALLSASACSFIGPPNLESGGLTVLMEAVMVCPVSTVVHIPRSVRPLLAKVLSTELRNATSSLWGFVRLFLFAKVVLRMPPFRQRRRRFVLASMLMERLHVCLTMMDCTLYVSLYKMIFVSANPPVVLRLNYTMFLELCFGHVKDDIVMLFSHSLLLV